MVKFGGLIIGNVYLYPINKQTKKFFMNYITQLQQENREQREILQDLQTEINEMLIYYTGSKFQGFSNDFAHVSTDILTKLFKLREKAYIHIKKEKI